MVIQPPPTVTLEIDGLRVRLRAGESDGPVTVLSIDVGLPKTVSANGKNMYRVTGVAGESVTEYVRSEQRAREIFHEKFPGQEVSHVSLT